MTSCTSGDKFIELSFNSQSLTPSLLLSQSLCFVIKKLFTQSFSQDFFYQHQKLENLNRFLTFLKTVHLDSTDLILFIFELI